MPAEERRGYRIRHACPGDRDRILSFIRRNWNEGHVFVRAPQVLDFQHVIEGKLTFVIGESPRTGELLGIQGYIPSNSSSKPDVWGAMWSAGAGAPPGLGLKIHEYTKVATRPRVFAAVGVGQTSLVAHRRMGHICGELSHYYRLAQRDTFHVAVVQDRQIPEVSPSRVELRELPTLSALSAVFCPERYRHRRPHKDLWYLEWRYLTHPFYSYRIHAVDTGRQAVDSVLVTREQEQHGARILRIVDFIGLEADFARLGPAIQRLMDRHRYEYVDCYCHGLSRETMIRAGLRERRPDDPNIIPNYFEPFEQRNVSIGFISTDDRLVAFKADGDQDRPSLIQRQGL